MFTVNQIQNLLSVVDYHNTFLVVSFLGKEVLDDYDKFILKQHGVDVDEIHENTPPTYFQQYMWGKLSATLKEKDAKDIKYEDFEKYIKRGQYIPLSPREQREYEISKQKSYSHLKGLGTKIKGDISNILTEESVTSRLEYEKVIKDEIARGVLERKSVKSIISEIGHKTEVWNHDWARIVETESNNAFQEGRASQIIEEQGEDAKVFKDVYGGACFPTHDTEYMTNEGFKKLNDIRGDEKIMSFNTKNNYCEWANIKSIIKYHYKGDLHSYKNSTLDLISTPNHNHLIGKRVRWEKKDTYENKLIPSENLRNLIHRDVMYLSSEGWSGYKDEYITLYDKTFKTEYFAKFLGWWLSDGHIYFRRKNKNNKSSTSTSLVITQTKEHNFKEIVEAFNGMFPDKKIYRSSEQFIILLDKNYDDISNWFIKLGHATTKYIPDEILNLDKKYLLMFLDSFRKGDGHKENKEIGKNGKEIGGRINLYTSSKKMADNLCEVVLKCGFNPGFSCRDNIGKTSYKKNGKSVTTKHLRYIVGVNSRKYVKNINNYFSIIKEWEGEVGCLELDKNFTLFIRRNNKSIWTGNCRHCIRLYLTGGIGSQPKIFKISDLIANGDNIGVKVNDWKPVVSSTHPHCRCTLRSLPIGYKWDEEKEQFARPTTEEYVPKVERKSKVKITIGDVVKYV